MRAFLIIATLAVAGCGNDNSPVNSATTAYAMAETAVHREFASAVIAHPVFNVANGASVVCGYVSTTTSPVLPTAAFIWTAEGLQVSRWYDEQYVVFDRRAKEVCGPEWVQPARIPAVS